MCVSVSVPSPGRGPCLAFPSTLPAAQPLAVWTAPAGSADCSQIALCTETNITCVTQVYCMTWQEWSWLIPTLIIGWCCYTDLLNRGVDWSYLGLRCSAQLRLPQCFDVCESCHKLQLYLFLFLFLLLLLLRNLTSNCELTPFLRAKLIKKKCAESFIWWRQEEICRHPHLCNK